MSNQIARPMADAHVGNWTTHTGGTTDLYQAIRDGSDLTYIESEQTPDADVYVCKLEPIIYPDVDTGFELHFRFEKNVDAGASITLTVELREGYENEGAPGTLIASDDFGNPWIDGSLSLTEGEVQSVTDWTDLYVRFVADVDDEE